MLNLFNSLGKRMEKFVPANASVTNIFTCGPSVYQRSHIGNYRTFLFEDTLVRYLEYCGFRVTRGMNFTDIEDKALVEARRRGTTLRRLTTGNIGIFTKEMKQLRMKTPDYLPRASENVESAVEISRASFARVRPTVTAQTSTSTRSSSPASAPFTAWT